MGGSVAKALKRRAPRTAVFGIDPDDEGAALASRDGVVRACTLADCDPDGAVVVFAAPLDVAAGLVRATAATWSRAERSGPGRSASSPARTPDSAVTDVSAPELAAVSAGFGPERCQFGQAQSLQARTGSRMHA